MMFSMYDQMCTYMVTPLVFLVCRRRRLLIYPVFRLATSAPEEVTDLMRMATSIMLKLAVKIIFIMWVSKILIVCW